MTDVGHRPVVVCRTNTKVGTSQTMRSPSSYGQDCQGPGLEKHVPMSESERRHLIEVIGKMMTPLAEIPVPTLGLDLDGVLDESPVFFSTLTHVWPGKVVIVTYRDDRSKAQADLANLGVRYDELVLVDNFDAKAQVIVEKGISIFVDDQPECLRDVPPTVTVLLMRNGGNFSYEEKLWTMSERTGKLI